VAALLLHAGAGRTLGKLDRAGRTPAAALRVAVTQYDDALPGVDAGKLPMTMLLAALEVERWPRLFAAWQRLAAGKAGQARLGGASPLWALATDLLTWAAERATAGVAAGAGQPAGPAAFVDYLPTLALARHATEVRKTPGWPGSRASSSLLSLAMECPWDAFHGLASFGPT
jgi:hypothetical protein